MILKKIFKTTLVLGKGSDNNLWGVVCPLDYYPLHGNALSFSRHWSSVLGIYVVLWEKQFRSHLENYFRDSSRSGWFYLHLWNHIASSITAVYHPGDSWKDWEQGKDGHREAISGHRHLLILRLWGLTMWSCRLSITKCNPWLSSLSIDYIVINFSNIINSITDIKGLEQENYWSIILIVFYVNFDSFFIIPMTCSGGEYNVHYCSTWNYSENTKCTTQALTVNSFKHSNWLILKIDKNIVMIIIATLTQKGRQEKDCLTSYCFMYLPAIWDRPEWRET